MIEILHTFQDIDLTCYLSRLLIPSELDGTYKFLASANSPYISAYENNVDEYSIVIDKDERLERLLLEPKTAIFSSVQHVILSQEYKKCLVNWIQ